LSLPLEIINPFNGQPQTVLFRVAGAVHLTACSQSSASGNLPAFVPGSFCTNMQEEWSAPPTGTNAGSILDANFASVYPAGATMGIEGTNCAAGTFYNTFLSQTRIRDYLSRFGPAAPLSACQGNTTSDPSGVFGGDVLALELNVDFNNHGLIFGSAASSFANLTLCGTGTWFDGKSVSRVLKNANRVFAGGALPPGFNVTTLDGLVSQLNLSFDNCGTPTTWAELHLASGACP
jgi:hypothetical protein